MGKNSRNAPNCKFPERGIPCLSPLSCTAYKQVCGDLEVMVVMLMIYGEKDIGFA